MIDKIIRTYSLKKANHSYIFGLYQSGIKKHYIAVSQERMVSGEKKKQHLVIPVSEMDEILQILDQLVVKAKELK